MKTVVIDYGMGNLLSVQRAFEKCGSDAVIIDNPLSLREAEHIVLPGVGAFPDAMGNLQKGGWIEELNRAVLEKKIPILGICLGMQLLAEEGFEGKPCKGLGFISGQVVRLEAQEEEEKIPHVGWNEIEKCSDTPLLNGIMNGTNYYFVHSYHFQTAAQSDIAGMTPYCGGFVSAVAKDNILGTQFHPEKSQKAGFRLIKNFLAM
ncbi:MAG: imidazole glycerol phosphate synthase subunit HisH [Lachnospiraceae bacterium]